MSSGFGDQIRDFAKGVEKKLETLVSLDGQQLNVEEVFDSIFMRANTPYPDFEAMRAAIGVSNADVFQSVNAGAWEEHVRANTHFSSWAEMQASAIASLVERRSQAQG